VIIPEYLVGQKKL